ncbi:PWWP domain-containing DNA repair factor 3A [Gastrophryne carolinensis]
MEYPKYVFCKWKDRLWPAKVLKQPLSMNNMLEVEIFEVQEQTSVTVNTTKPFLMVELEKISNALDRSEKLLVTPEEVKYRGALKNARDLLKKLSTTVHENKKISMDDTSLCTVVQEGEKSDGIRKSPRKKVQEKQNLKPAVSGSKSTLKRKLHLNADSTAKLSKCHEDLGMNPSDKPYDVERSEPKDTGDGDINVKKRTKDRHTEIERLSCKKRVGPNLVSHSNITSDTHMSEKHTDKGRSQKSKNTRNTLKRTFSASEESQPPDPDKNDAAKDKTSGQDGLSCVRKNNSRTVSPSKTSTDECKSGKNRDMKSRLGKVLATENEGNHVLSPDPVKADDKSGNLTSRKDLPGLEQASKTRMVFNSSAATGRCSSGKSQEPPSFENADFVWCKFQRYPYWPSLVKSVRSKEKKATIIFVEECLSDPESKKQCFQVSFRTLKHYDCPEKKELLGIARKDFGRSVDWCDALICDYRIRLGCGSFAGPFLEYCTAAISNPVRRECSNMKLNFPSVSPKICESPPHTPDTENRVKKKVLPDRSRASRDKANEKIVECILKAQQVETHLIDILKGKRSSLWLKKFQSFSRGVDCLETYLEDEEQIELVVNYLHTLCDKMQCESKKLMNGDQAKFILEVMLPEAVIFAIAATDDISYKKAEKKFLEGPLLSKRERKLFEKQILDKKAALLREKSLPETNMN